MSIVRVEKHNYTVEPLYQWDRNQVLEIYGLSLPSAPEVHFYNNTMDRAVVRQATMDSAGVITVSVPNGLLQKPYTITAHLCIYTGATFETQYTVKIPVTPRTQPADYTLEDDGDVYSFNELNNKVNQALAGIKEAESLFKSSINDLSILVGDILIDSSLSQTGKAAEAKAVGDALDTLGETLGRVQKVVDFSSVVVWEQDKSNGTGAGKTIAVDLSEFRKVSVIFENVVQTFYNTELFCSQKDCMINTVIGFDGGVPVTQGFSWNDDGVTLAGLLATHGIPTKIIGHRV